MSGCSVAPAPRAVGGPGALAIPVLASLALHAALVAGLSRLSAPPEVRAVPVSVEIVETTPPPPAPPATAPSPPRPSPRSARIRTPAPPDAPARARPDTAPPPPNAPPEAARPGPVRFGVSMSSTAEAGSSPVAVGGSLYGRVPERAPDPADARPRAADRYVEPSSVTTLPQPVAVELPRSEYPAEALQQGIEGVVRLRLVVDEEGRVREATVVSDPGHGLGPAAARAARRWFRFRPALKGGVAVATEIPFTVEFQLR